MFFCPVLSRSTKMPVWCVGWGTVSVDGAGGSLAGRHAHGAVGWGMHNRSFASAQPDTSTQRECVARQGLAQKRWCLTSFSFQGYFIVNFKSRHGWNKSLPSQEFYLLYLLLQVNSSNVSSEWKDQPHENTSQRSTWWFLLIRVKHFSNSSKFLILHLPILVYKLFCNFLYPMSCWGWEAEAKLTQGWGQPTTSEHFLF